MHLYINVEREMLNFVTAKVSHPKRYSAGCVDLHEI